MTEKTNIPLHPFSLIQDFLFCRRSMLRGSAAVLLSAYASPSFAAGAQSPCSSKFRTLEQQANGRLGAYIYDTANGSGFGWRENERFAHASSFKMSLAAMILAKGDSGQIDPDEILHWTKDDLMFVSPVTTENVDKGLSVKELARATLITSDNAAANVLLKRFGGPQELTRFWRSLGDEYSRLDRYEPELNTVPSGTELDTTTPAAMAKTTAALVHGNVLNHKSRTILKDWMTEVRTGTDRIRAGFPNDWISGDKTGTAIGDIKHTYVDIAFGGPQGRPPVVVAAYFEPAKLVQPMDPNSTAVLAEIGRIAAASIK